MLTMPNLVTASGCPIKKEGISEKKYMHVICDCFTNTFNMTFCNMANMVNKHFPIMLIKK